MMMYTLYGFDIRNRNKKITYTTMARNPYEAKSKYASIYPYFVSLAVYPNLD